MKKIAVTREEVLANMQEVIARTLIDFGKPTTYVAVRMKNGFIVRESETCDNPDNYDKELGKLACMRRIEEKIRHLLQLEQLETDEEKKEPQFEVGEWVLVRYEWDDKWDLALFAYYSCSEEGEEFHTFGGGCFYECLPYKGNEHLLGTTKMP